MSTMQLFDTAFRWLCPDQLSELFARLLLALLSITGFRLSSTPLRFWPVQRSARPFPCIDSVQSHPSYRCLCRCIGFNDSCLTGHSHNVTMRSRHKIWTILCYAKESGQGGSAGCSEEEEEE